MDIKQVKEKYEDALLKLPNVVGVAIGQRVTGGKRVPGEKVIKVYVKRKVRRSHLKPGEVIPETLEGYPTDVEEMGTISIE